MKQWPVPIDSKTGLEGIGQAVGLEGYYIENRRFLIEDVAFETKQQCIWFIERMCGGDPQFLFDNWTRK